MLNAAGADGRGRAGIADELAAAVLLEGSGRRNEPALDMSSRSSVPEAVVTTDEPNEQRLEAAADGTHEAVRSCIMSVGPCGRLLDAPCGSGALGSSLERADLEAYGVDVAEHPRQHLPKDRVKIADLDGGIPYEDGFFDAVVSVEGVEHLERPAQFIREASRVLRPGGHLVVSTPNILNVQSRWRFFTRGFHKHFTPDPEGRLSSGHIHPIDYVLLRYFLKRAGFEVLEIKTNRLLRGFRERIFSWLVARQTRRKHPFAADLLTDELLFGQILILVARKV